MNTYIVQGEKRDADGKAWGSDSEELQADTLEAAEQLFLARHGNGTTTSWVITHIEQKG